MLFIAAENWFRRWPLFELPEENAAAAVKLEKMSTPPTERCSEQRVMAHRRSSGAPVTAIIILE